MTNSPLMSVKKSDGHSGLCKTWLFHRQNKCHLQQRVIQGSITDKFEALCRVGQTPLCLFPTRNLCKQFNHEILDKIGTELHELVCADKVDQTSSTRKWSKKAVEHAQLEKLNNDCNMTAGLEANLVLAIGACVMLRRNIETTIGLVNGAIGTVLCISKEQIKVRFDHIPAPYDVESAKQIHGDEKFLRLQTTVYAHVSICYNHT